MELNDEERRCLELLVKWDQRVKGSCVERSEFMKEFGIDDTGKYEALIKKMEKIGAVCDVAQGMGQDYATGFKIPDLRFIADYLRIKNQ